MLVKCSSPGLLSPSNLPSFKKNHFYLKKKGGVVTYVFLHMVTYVFLNMGGYLRKPEDSNGFPRAGITGGCELSGVGAGKSKHFSFSRQGLSV